jgi:hypothetical protein
MLVGLADQAARSKFLQNASYVRALPRATRAAQSGLAAPPITASPFVIQQQQVVIPLLFCVSVLWCYTCDTISRTMPLVRPYKGLHTISCATFLCNKCEHLTGRRVLRVAVSDALRVSLDHTYRVCIIHKHHKYVNTSLLYCQTRQRLTAMCCAWQYRIPSTMALTTDAASCSVLMRCRSTRSPPARHTTTAMTRRASTDQCCAVCVRVCGSNL